MRKLFLVVFATATLSFAQKAPLSKQEEILIRLDKIEGQNTEILKILKEADAPPAPPGPVKIDVSESLALGDPNALVTIVEFTDMQCPFCAKFHKETWPELHDKYIATGKAKFVSFDLPLSMHQHAHSAAEAGRCAGEQGHFWEMRDWMQANPESLDLEHLREHAEGLDNFDLEKYRSCMALAKYADTVDADAKLAKDLGINGTPAFIVGANLAGRPLEGELIIGAQPLSAFERAIENQKNKLTK